MLQFRDGRGVGGQASGCGVDGGLQCGEVCVALWAPAPGGTVGVAVEGCRVVSGRGGMGWGGKVV